MKTVSITPAEIEKKWVLVDAEGQTLGGSHLRFLEF